MRSISKSTPLVIGFISLLFLAPTFTAAESLYFPPNTGEWEDIDPTEAGWDEAKLQKLINPVGKQKSSGLLILQNGKIIVKKHWPNKNYKMGEILDESDKQFSISPST